MGGGGWMLSSKFPKTLSLTPLRLQLKDQVGWKVGGGRVGGGRGGTGGVRRRRPF